MALNKQKGNMYGFVTHTFNTIKGLCEHNCTYCYMKRWKNQKNTRFDSKELLTDLGTGNFIFVGSSNDMFADGIEYEWILQTLEHCKKYNNKYLFQSKNPERFLLFKDEVPLNSIICTTIESDKFYQSIMQNSPTPERRAEAMSMIENIEKHVTIEPIMDFNLETLLHLVQKCNPTQVNIGADSSGHRLPEPTKEKVEKLINGLEQFTTVYKKDNLKRLINNTK